MISDHTPLSCSVTQFPPWSSHSPVCTITAVDKDLVRRPTRIHMILVSPPYRTNWGCLLADSGTIRREVTRPVAGRPSMFVLRSMRKAPRDFGVTFSVNHSRTGAVKLFDNTQGRASRLSSSGVPFAGLQPVPGGRNWAATSPRSKRMTRPCASRYSALELSPWAMPAHAVGNPGRPGRSRRGPAQAFSSIAAMYPVLASATAPAISGALSTRPQRRRRRWPDSKK